MEISVNNKQHTIENDTSLESLINQLNIEQNGIAIAINETIVSKNNWSKTQLKDKDKILVITATQGG